MKLDHIAINVSDIKKSIEWYVQNLSASVDYEDQTWAMLNVNNTRLALTISQEHPPHIAFNISDLSELQEQKINSVDLLRAVDSVFYNLNSNIDSV